MNYLRLRLGLFVALVLAAVPGRACTIFVLTDTSRTLFFNNEDFSNPVSRLWFVPAGKDYLGCAYVGFNDGWAQGGVNTAGLAFDWVADAMETYTPAADLKRTRGNSSQRMLETCTTVEEAIAFYRTHREVEFARATILIADRSGASVIIRAREGKLLFERDTQSRGFGYGGKILRERLARPPAPTSSNGVEILRACRQSGEFPTQYSNIFDLKSGEILVYPDVRRDDSISLSLAAELAKGGRSYDIPQLASQLTSNGRPLAPEQQRFYLDGWQPRATPDAKVVATIARLLQDVARDRMQAGDYGAEFWAKIASARADLQRDLNRLGELRRVVIVASPTSVSDAAGQRCIAEFSGARVLQRWTFDAAGRVTGLASEFVELERP